MIINFVGNYQVGYVGEVSDETHLARELEKLGHIVRRIPRDEWREYVIEGYPEGKYKNIPKDLKADINLIAKWHHFYDGRFITSLRDLSWAGSDTSKPPVFYWVWDFMYDQGFPDWHLEMAKAANLYLSGEGGIFWKYREEGVNPYYFQMDCCDGDLETFISSKVYDVIFTGSCIGQGHRKEYLTEINKEIPIKIWGWGHEEWRKLGFEAYESVYGEEYNLLISKAKIVLGFSVEPNCWGYWSNRVGKVLRAGGSLLQEYAPGMETLLPFTGIRYFNSPKEAIELIKYYLSHKFENSMYEESIKLTSTYKILQLTYLMERYLKGDPNKWNKLPI